MSEIKRREKGEQIQLWKAEKGIKAEAVSRVKKRKEKRARERLQIKTGRIESLDVADLGDNTGGKAVPFKNVLTNGIFTMYDRQVL